MHPIKRARLLSEMSQIELSKRAGVATFRIQRIEYGWTPARPDEIKKIAKALNVPQRTLEE
jgi:predicted transcriptional regulator